METVVAPVVAEPTTPIKPSEALRLGRLTRPVGIAGKLFSGSNGACAVGAMLMGSGMGPDDFENADREGYAWAITHWPGLPVGQIWMHNDDGESDDQIVAWLESMDL